MSKDDIRDKETVHLEKLFILMILYTMTTIYIMTTIYN